MPDLEFQENVENLSPSNSQFSFYDSSSVANYLYAGPTPSNLQDFVTQLLGSTSLTPSDGRLQRTPPMAHPLYSFQFCEAVTRVQGIGQYLKQASVGALEVPPLPNYALYDNYWISAKFAPRPFLVVTDDQIPLINPPGGQWYNDDGEAEQYYVAQEWLRYTDWDIMPQFEAVSAKQGTMRFSSSYTPATGGPDGIPFSGMPNMPLGNTLMKFRWFYVPFRYISSPNSYIAGNSNFNWIGRVNQNSWSPDQVTGYAPGQLLYLGYSYKKYTPPVPAQMQDFNGLGIFSTQKLCDIEFTFLVANRTPVGDAPTETPANKNYVVGGHNLLPWLVDRSFYYAETDPGSTIGSPNPVPSCRSFPLELLFFDPDVNNNDVFGPL